MGKPFAQPSRRTNLARGLAGFERLGLRAAGLRPPGGLLGESGRVLREAGLRYCSPAGAGAGEDRGVALLPFQWRHVDASCVLPPLAGAREQMTGSPELVDPATFIASLTREIDGLPERRRPGDGPAPVHARAGSATRTWPRCSTGSPPQALASEVWVAPLRRGRRPRCSPP